VKIYKGTIAYRLAIDIHYYGNVPYSALKLYPYDYESTKDAVQKLVRAGDIDVLKAKKSKTLRQNIKILHTTTQGRKSVSNAYLRAGIAPQPPAPVAYQGENAYRVGLISEAKIFIYKSGCGNFYSSQYIKKMLEENVRGSDSIKYSRFIGFRKRGAACTVTYHFGNKNMLLKANGEGNARQAAKEFSGKEVYSLILGDSMETLRSLLEYSIWFNQKPKSQRRHIRKLLFHIDLTPSADNDVAFLPVSRAAMPVVRMMADANWTEKMGTTQKAYLKDEFAVWVFLDCRIHPWVLHRTVPQVTSADKILILCYDWQESLAKEFFHEVTERKELWIQVLDSKKAEDWFFGRAATLPYAPVRLQCE